MSPSLKHLIASGFAAGLIATATLPALAGPEVNTATGAVLVNGKPAPGLAVHGFDVVAFFTDSKPVQGDAQFSTVYKAATYRFASQEHLATFKSNPEKYVPAYGGYCAYGVALGAKFDGDPRYWKIVDGKLYLNLSKDIQEAWAKDIPGSLKKANNNWTAIESKLPSDIK